ncbi:unnamed protein product [Angiostrongylus costaricensis]|uniref:Mitochondrial inner membrane protease subunit 2 n=1 Tax=Angiostrongylus costaricensis TaxID=334426 RepID=A0A0R3PJ20_ANGCS|nr:unnamed protein product [Angiostrongylus costaricensis]
MLRFVARMASSVCVAVTAFDVVGHPAVVTGASMSPTLEGSDARWWHRDMVWLTPRRIRSPYIGDIITFVSPREPDKVHIKRVTALEGDIDFRPKYRNEFMLVPKGCCWMESDNPENACDSNVYGPVSIGLMKNRATHIIWPPNRWKHLSAK